MLLLSLACVPQEQVARAPAQPAAAAPPAVASSAHGSTPRAIDTGVAVIAVDLSTSESDPPHDDPPSQGLAIRADSAGHPQFPITLHNICEGESCEPTFDGLVCLPIELHATEDDASPIVNRVAAGDTMQVTDVNFHMKTLGLVAVRRPLVLLFKRSSGSDTTRVDSMRYSRGDTLYLIRYYELGAWQWWYRGRTQSGGEFWVGPTTGGSGGVAGPHADTARAAAVALSHPKSDVWHRIVPRSGRPGWVSPRDTGIFVQTDNHYGRDCEQALGDRSR